MKNITIIKIIIIKITILSCAVFLLTGCDPGSFSQIVDVDIPEHESRLVLNARFSSDHATLSALVANSLGILDTSSYDIPEEAVVRLFREEEMIGDFAFEPGQLKYFAELPEPLGALPARYRMEVSAPGYEPISAEQRMPLPVPIQSLRFERNGAIDGEGRRADGIEIQFTDPALEENYYALEFILEFSEGQAGGDTIFYSFPLYASTLDQVVQYGYEYEQLFTDKSFNGGSYTVSLYLEQGALPEGTPDARLRARLICLSRDAFLYDLSRRQYRDAVDNPFAEPVTVHGNIDGGYGIFALSSAAEQSIPIVD